MKTVTVRLPVQRDEAPANGDPALLRAAAKAAAMSIDDVGAAVLRRRSLDARSRHKPHWVVRVDVFSVTEQPPDLELSSVIRPQKLAQPHRQLRPIIIGMGPAGLFAALRFADHGVRCTVVDRGAQVENRNMHVRDLRTKGELNPESNMCFGEGGAGTYSDGKLYTRGKNPRVRMVYERLVALGMTPRILVDAHPHVGTNRLIPMAKRLRSALLEAGHDLRFGALVDGLLVADRGGEQHVVGVKMADGSELTGGPVILAMGHSARDTYRMLASCGVRMQRKPFAVGARVEHPQSLIDEVQLGDLAGWPSIGAAEYFVRQQVQTHAGQRGVYSFCMCPGGFVLPSPTSLAHLNVNGMSNSNRGSRFGNAALVVQVQPQDMFLDRPGDLDDDPDFGAAVAQGALIGLAMQSRLERSAYRAGGGDYHAPAQRLVDFAQGRSGVDLPAKSSYRPGLKHADLGAVLPARIVRSMSDAAHQIDRRQLRGYLSDEAQIIGVETTTSSPVRIVRGEDRQSVSHRGLYPCAEGAGYAGGIVSSAIDGMLCAEMILSQAAVEVVEGKAND